MTQALARAVYSRNSVWVLDDVFSALDARLEAIVSERLLGLQGLAKQLRVTVFLVSSTGIQLCVSR